MRLRRAIENFGANVRFTPAAGYAPRDEAELLEILARHPGERVRAVGSLHAWSDLVVTEGISIDLRHFDQVRLVQGPEAWVAEVGAGCTIARLLRELRRQGNATLLSLGLIDAQTLAGATATATHGSGRNSLSHYIVGARVALLDGRSGRPVVQEFHGGPDLLALRCSLGCLGVITQLTVTVRPQYRIEEHFRVYPTLAPILEAEAEYPIQQFYLVPWSGEYFAQHRRETPRPRSHLAWVYRAYWITTLDVGLHLTLLLLVRVLGGGSLTRFFFRRVVKSFVVRRWRVVDRSDRQLTMQHQLFRHIETELFVPRARLEEALAFLRDVLGFLGAEGPLAHATRSQLERIGMDVALNDLAGEYTHHYPICVRRVGPDDALLSMASGGEEPWYAISLISFASPDRRRGFLDAMGFLTSVMGTLFEARPHWGKVCLLDAAEAERLYPRLPEFRAVCGRLDPSGRFRNDWTEQVLGFEPGT